MLRANRHYQKGHVWHITHRCHKKEFLLKFAWDHRACRQHLYQARKRYGLVVLDYGVTLNHIHLLVEDQGLDEISRSMQWVAGCAAQAYNRRRQRKGAFWEDRYQATAVDTDDYLTRCITYIDMNMVRAGAVSHPGDWEVDGYQEIQCIPARYRIVDFSSLLRLTGVKDPAMLQELHRKWIVDALARKDLKRERIGARALRWVVMTSSMSTSLE